MIALKIYISDTCQLITLNINLFDRETTIVFDKILDVETTTWPLCATIIDARKETRRRRSAIHRCLFSCGRADESSQRAAGSWVRPGLQVTSQQ